MRTRDFEIRPIYADTDAMGIVYHGTYVSWLEKGRTEWLRQVGYTYKRMEQEGLWLPVAHIDIDYKSPARYDDLLVVKTWVSKLKGASVEMGYEIVNKDTGVTVLTGTSLHPITDPNLKPLRLKRDYPELYNIIKEEMEA